MKGRRDGFSFGSLMLGSLGLGIGLWGFTEEVVSHGLGWMGDENSGCRSLYHLRNTSINSKVFCISILIPPSVP